MLTLVFSTLAQESEARVNFIRMEILRREQAVPAEEHVNVEVVGKLSMVSHVNVSGRSRQQGPCNPTQNANGFPVR